MATIGITSVTIRSDGWSADVILTGQSGQAGNIVYDYGLGANNDPTNAKVVFTVTSEGYDATGAFTTIERTVRGTITVRQPYPNEASLDEADSGGNLSFRMALSEPIYDDDKDGGAGTSGTNPTVTIAADWATNGADATILNTDFAVTNSSTLDYPRVLGNWAWPGQSVVGSSLDLEFIAFQRFGQDKKPVAAVIFTLSDASASTPVTSTITELSKSTRGETNTVLTYQTTLATTSLVDGDILKAEVQVYPWVGDADSVLDTDDAVNSFPTPLYTNQAYRLDRALDHGFTVVDATSGNDGTGVVFATQAAAEAGLAYQTLAAAITGVQAYNFTNAGHNDAGGGTLLLTEDNHSLNSTNGGVMTEWLVLTPKTGAAKASVFVTPAATNARHPKYMKIDGVTVTTANFYTENNTDLVWVHDCAMNMSGTVSFYKTPASYCTLSTGDLGTREFVNLSTNETSWAIIRGCNIPGTALGYTILGNEGIDLQQKGPGSISLDNSIIAFNSLIDSDAQFGTVLWAAQEDWTHGLAIVQNLLESTVGVSQALQVLSGDNSVNDTTNFLIWHNTFAGERCNYGYNSVGDTEHPQENWSVQNNIFENFNNKDDVFGSTVALTAVRDGGGGTLLFTMAGHALTDNTDETITVVGTAGYDGVFPYVSGSAGAVITVTGTYGSDEDPGAATATNESGNRIGSWPIGFGVGFKNCVYEGKTFPDEFDGINSFIGTPVYVSDQSAHGTGTGNGDYHLQSTSDAIGLVSNLLLPFDFEGNTRFIDSATNGGAVGAYEFGTEPVPATGGGLRGRYSGTYRSRRY